MEKGERRHRCCAPWLVLKGLIGVGLMAASLGALMVFYNNDEAVLFSSSLYYRLALFLAAGGGVIVSLGALCVLLARGRWFGLGVLLIVVCLSLSIGAACSGFVYAYSYLWRGDSYSVNDVMASRAYGKPGFEEITEAWDGIEATYLCTTLKSFLSTRYSDWRYRDSDTTAGPARQFYLNDTDLSCEEAYAKYHHTGALQSLRACSEQCAYFVPHRIRVWVYALSITAVVAAVIQLFSLLCILATECACQQETEKKTGERKRRQVVRGKPGWQVICLLGGRACSCSLGMADVQQEMGDDEENTQIIVTDDVSA